MNKTFDEGMVNSSHFFKRHLEDKWQILRDLYSDNIAPTEIKKIPKIIHQIWLGSQLPDSLIKMTESVKQANPGYEYRLWTDADAAKFEFENKELFNTVKNLGQKSDILRYAILKKYGGIYLDTDFIGFKSFDELLHLDFFVGVSYDDYPTLFNGLIGCTPKNELMAEINLFGEIRDNEGMAIIETTGPWYMTGKLFKHLKKAGKLVVLPVSVCYPYPNFQVDKVYGNNYTKYMSKDTICVHFWESRWN